VLGCWSIFRWSNQFSIHKSFSWKVCMESLSVSWFKIGWSFENKSGDNYAVWP